MDVKYNLWPDYARRSMTPDIEAEIKNVEGARRAGLIANNFELIVLANFDHYQRIGGMGIGYHANDGRVKTWYGSFGFQGVFAARAADLSYVTDPYSDSMRGLEATNRELMDFYKSYGPAHFPRIPRFVVTDVPFSEANRLQFGYGPGADFPVTKIEASGQSNFPKDIAFVVKEDGQLYWFRISEYKTAFPITVTASIPSPVQVAPEITLLGVSMTLANPVMTPTQKVEEIRRIVR